MREQHKAPSWVWIALVAVALVSLGCGLLFGGLGGYLLARGSQREASWRSIPAPLPEAPLTPRRWRLPYTATPARPEAAEPTPRPPITAAGALVLEVVEGAAADRAGLQVGDIITALDGVALTDENGLAAAIRARKPGDRVRLTIWRLGEKIEVRATLGERETEEGASIAYLGVTVSSALVPIPGD